MLLNIKSLELPGYEANWQIRTYGDEQAYARPPGKEGTTSYAVIALRSFKWPGAITVYQVIFASKGIRMENGSLCILELEFAMEEMLFALVNLQKFKQIQKIMQNKKSLIQRQHQKSLSLTLMKRKKKRRKQKTSNNNISFHHIMQNIVSNIDMLYK